MTHRLLLDTHVVLWLLLGDRSAIPEPVVDHLTQPANTVFVSAVSVWEIALKRSLGQLTIEDRWSHALDRLPFAPLPITAAHAAAVEKLPWHHRDPFDRLLVAQALVEEATLVTADRTLEAYAVPTLW